MTSDSLPTLHVHAQIILEYMYLTNYKLTLDYDHLYGEHKVLFTITNLVLFINIKRVIGD